MIKIELTREVFKTLKTGDIISNKQDFEGGPAGYDYEVVEGYQLIRDQLRNEEGCIKIRLIFGKDDKYRGQPYYFFESEVERCLGLYKKQN